MNFVIIMKYLFVYNHLHDISTMLDSWYISTARVGILLIIGFERHHREYLLLDIFWCEV